MKIGTRVKLEDNEMTRAWGYAGEIGTVIERDKRFGEVVQVKLDVGSSVFETKGLHVSHLIPLNLDADLLPGVR